MPVLLGSVLVNYYIGRHLRVRKCKKWKKKVWLLVLAVVCNAGLLALFKSGLFGGKLPLGMSFYTFQALSYLIDVYRGEVPAEASLTRFATYMAMFPRLASGPIVSYREVSGDLLRRKISAGEVQRGLMLFTAGLAAKVLLADRVGLLWHEVQVIGFESISTPLAWIAAVAYSLMLYFDFYGYSLMAVGLGAMLGFELPENFREPYIALSVRDFYRRWHITLGRWFCRYMYVPLGGSRKGELRTALNLLLVWLLTAFWHGWSVNFLIWGLLLWILIVLERQGARLTRRYTIKREGLRRLLCLPRHLYLWAVIPVTWMCFAITDLGQLQIYLGRMFNLVPQAAVSRGDWLQALENYGPVLLAGGTACLPFLKKWFRRWKDRLVVKVLLAALFWLCVWRITVEGDNPFMYRMF